MEDEIIKNGNGARKSKIGVKFTDFDPAALLRVGRVSAEGFAKYGKGNWKNIDQTDHIDHAINHLLEYQAGNTSEDHLAHAVCRVLFAMGTKSVQCKMNADGSVTIYTPPGRVDAVAYVEKCCENCGWFYKGNCSYHGLCLKPHSAWKIKVKEEFARQEPKRYCENCKKEKRCKTGRRVNERRNGN